MIGPRKLLVATTFLFTCCTGTTLLHAQHKCPDQYSTEQRNIIGHSAYIGVAARYCPNLKANAKPLFGYLALAWNPFHGTSPTARSGKRRTPNRRTPPRTGSWHTGSSPFASTASNCLDRRGRCCAMLCSFSRLTILSLAALSLPQKARRDNRSGQRVGAADRTRRSISPSLQRPGARGPWRKL